MRVNGTLVEDILTMVQEPNLDLAITHKKWITVHGKGNCKCDTATVTDKFAWNFRLIVLESLKNG